MSAGVAVRRCDGPAERDALIALRFRVFVDEQRCPPDEEIDAHDETATFLVAVAGGDVVGTARVVLLEDPARGPVVKIGRVAVDRAWRGRGLGQALVTAAVEEARRAGAREALLDAQTYALAFYERLGFRAEGAEFLDAGIPHRRMRRPLAA